MNQTQAVSKFLQSALGNDSIIQPLFITEQRLLSDPTHNRFGWASPFKTTTPFNAPRWIVLINADVISNQSSFMSDVELTKYLSAIALIITFEASTLSLGFNYAVAHVSALTKLQYTYPDLYQTFIESQFQILDNNG